MIKKRQELKLTNGKQTIKNLASPSDELIKGIDKYVFRRESFQDQQSSYHNLLSKWGVFFWNLNSQTTRTKKILKILCNILLIRTFKSDITHKYNWISHLKLN